ncbi:MAG: hypothetical protein V1718_02265 [archaeon]
MVDNIANAKHKLFCSKINGVCKQQKMCPHINDICVQEACMMYGSDGRCVYVKNGGYEQQKFCPKINDTCRQKECMMYSGCNGRKKLLIYLFAVTVGVTLFIYELVLSSAIYTETTTGPFMLHSIIVLVIIIFGFFIVYFYP